MGAAWRTLGVWTKLGPSLPGLGQNKSQDGGLLGFKMNGQLESIGKQRLTI